MSNYAVECPLCFRNFSNNTIEKHVENCGNESVCTSSNSRFHKETSSTLKRRHVNNEPSSEEIKRKSVWTKWKSTSVTEATKENKSALANELDTTNALISTNDSLQTSKNVSEPLKFTKPLYDMARPTCLDDYVGQTDVVGKDSSLYKLLQENFVPSLILWGPPGCGKTTLAHIIANNVKKHTAGSNDKIHFVKLSATDSGKSDLQGVIKTALNKQRMFACKTVLFIDEIHRFNKLQQDSLLPSVEGGILTLIGATTENPSFSLNSALLSRCRVITLKKLEVHDVKSLLLKTLKSVVPSAKVVSACTEDSSQGIFIQEAVLDILANVCDGDARVALNGLQAALQTAQTSTLNQKIVDVNLINDCLQRSHFLYDKTGDQHYDMISALHKSIRGSDDNAALYWLTRMMLGGEDPRYLARRLIRVATEDIGLADPNALNQAVSCYHACMYVGMPECDVALAQCAVYLARAPKSVQVYQALKNAKQCIKENVGPLPVVPLHLRNAPTKLMKSLGHGKDYKYNPTDDATGQTYLPDPIKYVNFFL